MSFETSLTEVERRGSAQMFPLMKSRKERDLPSVATTSSAVTTSTSTVATAAVTTIVTVRITSATAAAGSVASTVRHRTVRCCGVADLTSSQRVLGFVGGGTVCGDW